MTHEASIDSLVDQQTQVVDNGSGPVARCRICHADYQPRFSDGRCGLCKARRRYWRPEQLGSRAQVYVTARWSAFCGLTGIGQRVATPEDGWQIRLLESPERSLYFGGGSVEVDWEIRIPAEVDRGIWAATRSFRLAATRKTSKEPAPSLLARFPRTG